MSIIILTGNKALCCYRGHPEHLEEDFLTDFRFLFLKPRYQVEWGMPAEDMQRPFGQRMSKGSKKDYASSVDTLSCSGMLWGSWGARLHCEHPNRGTTHDNNWTNNSSAPISNLLLCAAILWGCCAFLLSTVSPGAKNSAWKTKLILKKCFFYSTVLITLFLYLEIHL